MIWRDIWAGIVWGLIASAAVVWLSLLCGCTTVYTLETTDVILTVKQRNKDRTMEDVELWANSDYTFARIRRIHDKVDADAIEATGKAAGAAIKGAL